MGTYSTHACHNCQIRRSAVYMKLIEVTAKSGKSGWVEWKPMKMEGVVLIGEIST